MKRLTKAQRTQRDDLQTNLDKAGTELTEALQAYEEAIDQAWVAIDQAHNKVVNAVGGANGAIGDANNWRQEIVDRMQAYFDDHSERWQESDAGTDYEEWIQEWDAEIDEVEEPDQPERPEKPEAEVAVALDDMFPDSSG